MTTITARKIYCGRSEGRVAKDIARFEAGAERRGQGFRLKRAGEEPIEGALFAEINDRDAIAQPAQQVAVNLAQLFPSLDGRLLRYKSEFKSLRSEAVSLNVLNADWPRNPNPRKVNFSACKAALN